MAGTVLFAGWLAFAVYFLSPSFGLILSAAQKERVEAIERIDFVWLIAGLTGLPGLAHV
jgi:hypothetical protein